MKKENNQKKNQYPEVELGTKLRNVKINQKQHFLLFVTLMVVFNMLLLMSVWFVLINLNTWYNWVICIVIVFICWGLSLRAYCNVKNFHTCTLYDNALVVNSIWFNFEVDVKNICGITVKETVLDKIFKTQTKSLEINIIGCRRKKFTLHFIEEDVEQLKWEILKLVDAKSEIDIAKND